MFRSLTSFQRGLVAISLVLLLGVSWGGSWSSEDALRADPNLTLADRLRADIDKALRTNASARSFEEWAQSGYTPADIFAYVRELKSAEANRDLCAIMSRLDNENLALFANALETAAQKKELSCAPELLTRLKKYWAQETYKLSAALIKPHVGVLPEIKLALPSEEKRIDASTGPSYSRGDLKDGEIALTFDDGPHGSRTQKILAILKEAGVRATFFQIGQNARAMSGIARQVLAEGHTVASHTWSHPNLPKLTLAHAEQEIDSGRQAVAFALNLPAEALPFFRFPYGSRSDALKAMVKSKGMASFLWNMDTLDWKLRNPRDLFQNVLKELDREKGGIMLFHDVHEQTVIVLPHLLDELRARKFSTVVFVPHT